MKTHCAAHNNIHNIAGKSQVMSAAAVNTQESQCSIPGASEFSAESQLCALSSKTGDTATAAEAQHSPFCSDAVHTGNHPLQSDAAGISQRNMISAADAAEISAENQISSYKTDANLHENKPSSMDTAGISADPSHSCFCTDDPHCGNASVQNDAERISHVRADILYEKDDFAYCSATVSSLRFIFND